MDNTSKKSDSVRVHNVLASATLACSEKIDLDKCSMIFGNSYYNPEEFPALRIDIRGMNSSVYTISMFESGRIQSTGSCRSREIKRAMLKIGRRLTSKLGYHITFCNFEIQNILAVYDSCYSISLNSFTSKFQGFVDYEPDRFPAARVRIVIPPLVSSKKDESSLQSPAQEIQSLQNSSTKEDTMASVKIRRLLMGELEDKNNVSCPHEATALVGSYIMTSGSKRSHIHTRLKKERLIKEECVTANVFSTGKITFTGAKSIRSLRYALDKLKPGLEPEQPCALFWNSSSAHSLPYFVPNQSPMDNSYTPSQSATDFDESGLGLEEPTDNGAGGKLSHMYADHLFPQESGEAHPVPLLHNKSAKDVTQLMRLFSPMTTNPNSAPLLSHSMYPRRHQDNSSFLKTSKLLVMQCSGSPRGIE